MRIPYCLTNNYPATSKRFEVSKFQDTQDQTGGRTIVKNKWKTQPTVTAAGVINSKRI